MIGLFLLLFVLVGATPAAAVVSLSTGVPRAASAAAAETSGVVEAPDSLLAAPPDRVLRILPSPHDRITTLPEVRIERDRALREARRRVPTGFVTEIRTGVSGRAIETLAEVLVSAAGVRVVQYGGLGAFSTVSIRGAPPGQVAVYLDGVPLTSAAHGVVNLADIPLSAVDRVEVYRALSPLSLGVATPGGAINLITRAAPNLREANLARGSFDTWDGSASLGGKRGPLAALLHVGYAGSQGDFAFFDDNGTGAQTNDDAISVRENNRYDASTALATLELTPGAGVRVRLREDLFSKRQGVPGLGVNQAHDTRLAFHRSITQLEAVTEGQRFRPGVRLGGTLFRERSRFRDLALQLGLGRHDTDDRTAGKSVALSFDWPRLPLGLSVQVGGALREERGALKDVADGYPDPPESRRQTHGVHAGIQIRPLGRWLTLHAARRWDRLDDRLRSLGVAGTAQRSDVRRTLDSPQLGAQLDLTHGFELRANWAEAERAPDFMELFGNQGSVLGNPRLLPEHGENHDFGIAWSGAPVSWLQGAFEAVHFESRGRDLILYARNSASSVKALNVSRARIRGEELSVRWRGPAGLALSWALTWSSSIDQGGAPAWRGKHLPQRPDRQASARLDWTRGRLRASADVLAIGRNPLDRYNLYWAESRTLTGASVSILAFHDGLRFTLEGKNLGDHRVSDVGGFPLPGRSVFLACHARLGTSSPSR